MYTRGELALRIGLFYTTASLSGAFGGLLARGLAAIGTRGGLASWRWIFVIEGLMVGTRKPLFLCIWPLTFEGQTALVGIASYFLLPNGIATAKFLTHEEREFALRRLVDDTSSNRVSDDR